MGLRVPLPGTLSFFSSVPFLGFLQGRRGVGRAAEAFDHAGVLGLRLLGSGFRAFQCIGSRVYDRT